MPAKVLHAIENNLITGDVICFWENDDWFRDDYIAWLESMFEKQFEIVGEGHSTYYHVRNRWWSECKNCRHSALVQTAIHADLLESVSNIIRSYDSPFFDTRIHSLDANKFLHLPKGPEDRRVVGIKGMTGTKGYSGEHAAIRPPETHTDPSLRKLWEWIGEDALNYAEFYDRHRST